MVLASNGGVVDAAMRARSEGVAGALASGLHHARREQGRGFCTFNGLAIAALELRARGVKRILVIDLDAHCGGGSHSLIGRLSGVHQLDIAVDEFDHYTPAGANTLDLVTQPSRYLPTLEARLAALANLHFDICLYNAGMDPHQDCPVGGLPGIDAALLQQREQRVFSWCGQRKLPVAFVLAGGYLGPNLDQAGLVDLHRLTLKAAANLAASRARA
jgi:acetoin utilization deacetylase AcuC-like enzyme